MHSLLLTLLALLAFASNSLLCRAALREGGMDPASFTLVRVLSGAVVLAAILLLTRPTGFRRKLLDVFAFGDWFSAALLFVYAAGFSLAYVVLDTATGALLLFAAVQATMMGRVVLRGDRMGLVRWLGLACAMSGLLFLLLPGTTAPSWLAAGSMLLAGLSWGLYSIRGERAGDALAVTAGNFARALPMAAILSIALVDRMTLTPSGVGAAVVSGGLASGLGYAVWYKVLPLLRASTASLVQLSVPALAALGAVLFLNEALTARVVIASLAILGGILLATTVARALEPKDTDASSVGRPT